MALRREGENDKSVTGAAETTVAKETIMGTAGTEALTRSIGFGSGLRLMKSDAGDAVVTRFVEALRLMYKETKVGVASVETRDYPNLAYSSVVVYAQFGDTVYNYIILIEDTGRAPLTATQIVEEITAMQRSGGFADVYVASDAIDKEYMLAVDDLIRKRVGAGKFGNIVNLDGVVVHYGEVEDSTIRTVGAMAYNAINAQVDIESGEVTDISIPLALQAVNNASLVITSRTTQQTITDHVGSAKRSDFRLSLGVVNRANRTVGSPNAKQGDVMVTSVSGYIDAFPDEVQMPNAPYGQFVNQRQRLMGLHPHIIVNLVDAAEPTVGYALMSIITGRLMAQDNMLMSSLLPASRSAEHQVGSLNVITNAEGNANGVGEVIDLLDKGLTSDETVMIIRRMFSLAPIYSIDIEKYGPSYYTESAFSAAGGQADEANSRAAAKAIMDTASWLTGNHFDFAGHSPFVGEGIVLPAGYWIDRNGVKRDIAEIDLAFIANHTGGDVSIMNRYVNSCLPSSRTGLDPYIERCAVIADIVGNAVIEGKVTRLMFSVEFIESLERAAVAAGFTVSYDAAITLSNQNIFGQIGGYLSAAGIGSNAGFASQRGGQVSGYRIPTAPTVRRY